MRRLESIVSCRLKIGSLTVDLDAVRNGDISVYATVRQSFMTYLDRSVWRRERTFNPCQITEMRGYTDLGATRFEDFDTEDMVAEPSCRT